MPGGRQGTHIATSRTSPRGPSDQNLAVAGRLLLWNLCISCFFLCLPFLLFLILLRVVRRLRNRRRVPIRLGVWAAPPVPEGLLQDREVEAPELSAYKALDKKSL